MDKIISDNTLSRLTEAYVSKNFCFIEKNPQDNFLTLMPWPEINRIIRQCRLQAPRMRMHKEGQMVSEHLYTEKASQRRGTSYNRAIESLLYNHLQEGATLIIDAIDELHQKLDEFCGFLERTFRNSLQVNAYMSWGDNMRGFETHWDDHDVIILQLYGKKHWFLFGQTRRYPLYRDLHEEEEPPANPKWDKIIEAGDILFIPRGHWHHAVAMNEPSLHLTMGFTCRTGLEYVQWIKEKLTEKDFFRKDIPALSTEKEILKYNKILKETLFDVLEKHDVEEYLCDVDGRMENRSLFSLPWVVKNADIPDNCQISLNTSFISNYRNEGDTIKFTALDKNYQFSIKTKAIFDKLMDFKKHLLSDLFKVCKGELEENQVREFIKELIGQGLLAARENSI